MTDWIDTIRAIAPTVATALGGPLAGAAVTAIGAALGVGEATTDTIGKIITDGQLKPENLAELRKLEMQYKAEERERGFRYAELAYKDRDSARTNNVAGGTQRLLFWMSMLLLVATLGSEIWVLFQGYPDKIPEIIVGRVLGLMDSVALLVLSYWYGTSAGSVDKNQLLANAVPQTKA